LAAACDEDIRAFIDEPLRGRQPDTAASAGDHGDLAGQSCHQLILQFSCDVVDVLLRRAVVRPPRRCAATLCFEGVLVQAVAMCSPGHSS
jgi:hypothetical protein